VRSLPRQHYSGLEAASQSDRDWFEQNPHRNYRIRTEIPGEFPEPRRRIDRTKWTVWTLVKQLEPGIRARTSIGVLRGAGPVDTDPSIAALLECIVTGGHGEPGVPIKKNSTLGEGIMRAFLPPLRTLNAGSRCLGGVQ
jgi:hypothetical protein